MPTQVQPSPRPPSAWRIALSGAIGLALGLGLVGWSMGKERPVAEPGVMAAEDSEAGGRGSEAGGRSADPETGDRGSESDLGDRGSDSEPESEPESESQSEPEPESESEPDSESESESDSEPEPEAGTPTVTATAAAGTPGSTDFERGRVAFLRCGEPDVRCGRDRDFEEAAWAILAELPSCPALAGRSGTGDVRIHRTGSGRELRFRDWGETPLPIGALQGCLESGGLADLPIGVDGSPLIVSFRFRLR